MVVLLLFRIQLDDKHFVYRNINLISGRHLLHGSAKVLLVYIQPCGNQTSAGSIMDGIRKNSPEEGIVQMLSITEKQFGRMEYVCGGVIKRVLDSDERLIIL